MATGLPAFETISLGCRQNGIAELLLNRPLKGNSLNEVMWQEIPEALRHLDALADVRVVSPRLFSLFFPLSQHPAPQSKSCFENSSCGVVAGMAFFLFSRHPFSASLKPSENFLEKKGELQNS